MPIGHCRGSYSLAARLRARTRIGRAIESLEVRRLFSTPIFGTAGNDTFVINVQSDNRIFLLFNGTSEILPAPTSGNLVEVFGYVGNDNIWIQSTNDLEFKIYDSGGTETYRVGQGNVDIDLARDVTLFDTNVAGDAPDTLTIEDGVGNGTPWMTDGTRYLNLSSFRAATVVWTLGSEDSVVLNGGTGNDYVYVEGLRPNFRMNLSAGDDTLDLGGGQNRCDYFMPAGVSVSVDGGEGNDTLIVDDANAASTLSTLRLDDDALLNGIDVNDFSGLSISTHAIPSGSETVQFTGARSPGRGNTTINGSTGADIVQLGTASASVNYGSGYMGGSLSLALGAGANRLNLYDGVSVDSRSWAFNGSTVQCNGQWPITCNNTIEAHFYGTDHADTFVFNSTAANWVVYADGRAGDDTFTNGTANDIDAAFGASYPLITGGNGNDSVFLGDSSDQVGDVDEYLITSVSVSKGDFGNVQAPMLYMTDGFERVNLTCDADGNLIRFTSAASIGLLEIDGFNGNDTFTNVSAGGSGANMSTTLPVATSLAGGAGSDTVALDDHFSSTSGYDINAGDFAQINAGTRHVRFNTIDRFSLDGSDAANTIRVFANPTSSPFAVNGAGGDDTFTVGGGDIDSNGFTLSSSTVSGGLGTDSITFDDFLDAYSASETETYALETLSLAKGPSAGFRYSGFEVQKLNAGDGAGSGNLPSTVNLNATNGSITNTTIQGGAIRNVIVNVGNPFLFNIAGSVTTTGGAAGMTVNYNDAVGTGDRQYLVETNEVYLTTNGLAHLFYSNLTALNINAGSGNDQILVEGVPAGTTVNAHGNNGNDLIVVGNFGSFITTILGSVNTFGDAGTDEARWASFDSGAISATLTASAFTHLGRIYSYATVENLWVNFFNTAALTLNVQSTALPTLITSGPGGDSISLGGGNYANLLSNVTVNCGNGDDSVVIDDHLAVSGTYYILSAGDLFEPFAVSGTVYAVDSNDAEHLTIRNGSGNDTDQVETTSLDLAIEAGGGDDLIYVKDSAGPVNIDTGGENGSGLFFQGDAVYVNSDADTGDTGATARIAANDRVFALDVRSSGTSAGMLRVGTGATLNVTSSIALSGGTIDLAGGSLLLAAATGMNATQARNLITAGRGPGTWSGTSPGGAINSSLAGGSPLSDAVGSASGAQVALSTLGGFPIAAVDTVVRYALQGDTNLNGAVSFDDLLTLAQNYGMASGATWSTGDSNYNNAVAFEDLLSLAQNYGAVSVYEIASAATRRRSIRNAAAVASAVDGSGTSDAAMR